MTKIDQLVFVVDDDPSMRGAIKRLLGTVGLGVKTFASAQEFLDGKMPELPCCAVLDVRLPGPSGLELQREMAARGLEIPIIFITGHGDIPMSVQAMKAGAIDFLTKPFRDQDLLDAIERAIDRDRHARRQWSELSELREHLDSLTPRERAVIELVVGGMANKEIAGKLGISEKTVKVHRSQVMRKMCAKSLVGLVRMADKLGISSLTG